MLKESEARPVSGPSLPFNREDVLIIRAVKKNIELQMEKFVSISPYFVWRTPDDVRKSFQSGDFWWPSKAARGW